MKKWVMFLLINSLLLASCQYNPLKLIHHEKPNIETDFSPFQDIGCDQTTEKENRYACDTDSSLFVLGCDFIEQVSLLGGLTPNYPIALCIEESNQEYAFAYLPEGECVHANGFMTTFCYRYLIYRDGKFQLIKTMDSFRDFFAPVDSPDEALSFALATGWYTAKYNQTKLIGYIYTAQLIEDTHVDITTDGYIVHVFYTPQFGCDIFTTSAVAIKVSLDGFFKKINQQPLYHLKEMTCKE